MRPAAQRGMSIIEIVITIAIVGLLLALAAPSAATWIQNTQLRNAAESALNGIQLARVEAIKRNQVVAFQLTDTNSTAWQVCVYDVVNNACSGVAGSQLASRGPSEGSPNARFGVDFALSDTSTAIDPGTAVPGTLAFDTFGRLATTNPNNVMRIDVRNPQMNAADERRLVILINIGGNVRMCDPRLSLAANPQGCA
jgi:type IV fimbrial biogenesis protein FimT